MKTKVTIAALILATLAHGAPEPMHNDTKTGVVQRASSGAELDFRIGSKIDGVPFTTKFIPSLTDPNADRILFWDDSANGYAFLSLGAGLSITGTTLNTTSAGDFSSNTSTSVDSEIVLFSGTLGKTGKRATGSGIPYVTSGVFGVGDGKFWPGSHGWWFGQGPFVDPGTATVVIGNSDLDVMGTLLVEGGRADVFNIAAPATPAATMSSIYVDSTSKNLSVKNDAGVVNHGAQTKTAATHKFFNSLSNAGVLGDVQPSSTDLGDFSTTPPSSAGQIPIFDGSSYVPGDPLVQGLFANGSSSTANPVVVGGYDTAGATSIRRATVLNSNPAGTEYAFVTRPIPNGTQTISGTVTANAGTNLNTSALALESGGNLATVAGAVRAEDAASADGHTGIGALAVRKATPANTSGADGDYEFLQMSVGRLWVSALIDTALPTGTNVIGALSANQSVNVAQVNGVTPLMGAGNTGTGSPRVTIASDQATLPVSVASVPAHAVTNAGTFAVQATEADGANTTLGAKADAKSTATDTTSIAAMQVLKQISASVQAPPSQAVTNAGTFAVQADTELPAAAAAADGASNPTAPFVSSANSVFNGSTWDRWLEAANALNSTGTGLATAQLVAQFDDTSPTAITENRFGNLRMSANRNIYDTIRDAAGNERGANVNASNQLSVSVDNTVTVGSHAVTNAGTFAVQATEADGANTTLGAKADAKSTATDTTSITAMQVLKQISASVQAPPSQAVTNAGTFAVQSTLQANSGVDIGKLTANQSVNVAQVNGVTPLMGAGNTGTGSPRVTIASDQATLPVSLAANQSVNVAQVNGVTPLMGAGNTGTGSPRVTISSDQAAIPAIATPTTSGGLTTYHLVSAATTNATNIKASAGQVYGWYIYNSNAAARKVAFHNASGTPTAGASIFMSLVIPPSGAANVEMTNGIAFSTGIAISTTTGLADNDTAAVAANDLVINIFYK